MNHVVVTVWAIATTPVALADAMRFMRAAPGSGPRSLLNSRYRIRPNRERAAAFTMLLAAVVNVAVVVSDFTVGEVEPVMYFLIVPVLLGFWIGEQIESVEVGTLTSPRASAGSVIWGRSLGLLRVVVAGLAVVVGLGFVFSSFLRVTEDDLFVPAAVGAALATGIPIFLARPSRGRLLVAVGVALAAGGLVGWLVVAAVGGG